MFSLKSLTAFTALTLISQIDAHVISKRNNQITEPGCPLGEFAAFTYVGCYNDPSTPNALQYNSYLPGQNMTVEICSSFCKGNGFKYAGLEYYGTECYCGSAINGPNGASPAPSPIADSNCNNPCSGDSTETMCGGTDIIAIYEDPTFLPASLINDDVMTEYVYEGCYTDLVGDNGRSLQYQLDLSGTVTTFDCLTACKAEGYSYAGLEYGGQCFCGMNLGPATSTVDDSKCNTACSGGTSPGGLYPQCGGPSLLSVYYAVDLISDLPCGATPPPPPTTTSSSSSTAPTSTISSSASSSTSTSSTSSTHSTGSTSTTSSTSAHPTSTGKTNPWSGWKPSWPTHLPSGWESCNPSKWSPGLLCQWNKGGSNSWQTTWSSKSSGWASWAGPTKGHSQETGCGKSEGPGANQGSFSRGHGWTGYGSSKKAGSW